MRSTPPRTLRNVVVILIIIGLIFLSLAGVLRPILGVILDPFVAAQRWVSERFMATYDFFTNEAKKTEIKIEIIGVCQNIRLKTHATPMVAR